METEQRDLRTETEKRLVADLQIAQTTIEKLKRDWETANRRKEDEVVENGVLKEIIDTLIDKIARG